MIFMGYVLSFGKFVDDACEFSTLMMLFTKFAVDFSEFECPVCFEEMRPPTRIFQCVQGHVVCEVQIL